MHGGCYQDMNSMIIIVNWWFPNISISNIVVVKNVRQSNDNSSIVYSMLSLLVLAQDPTPPLQMPEIQ